MAFAELVVDIAELVSAANNMQNALETYQGAIDNLNEAAADLASKWEGDGQVAFVNDQAAAYKWYNSLVQVVQQMIKEASLTAQRYRDHVAQLKSQM